MTGGSGSSLLTISLWSLFISEVQRRMLGLYLTDGVDLDGFLAWQERNLDAACANLKRRKELDWDRLDAQWRAKAPARRSMVDLPEAALAEPTP